MKDISYVLNFDLPTSYSRYKETSCMVCNDGAVINLVSNDKKEAQETLKMYQTKLEKSFGKTYILKCIPIIWHEVVKMKARVDTVLSTLSTKRVKDEKVLEFKKQIVSNKSLKEYFKNNPNEKEILQNDIQKNSYKDKILFRNLGTLPSYAVPKEIMATTKD